MRNLRKKINIFIVAALLLAFAVSFQIIECSAADTEYVHFPDSEAIHTESGEATESHERGESSEVSSAAFTVGEVESIPVEGGSEQFNTLFSRVYEFIMCNLELSVVAVCFLILVILFIIIKNSVRVQKKDVTYIAKSQPDIIEKVNGMIDAYNSMRADYSKNQNAEEERNRLVSACLIQETALLEILVYVYANSRSLPHGVKDIVLVKYSQAQKAIRDDDILKKVIDAVKGVLEQPSDNDESLGVTDDPEAQK